MEKFNTKVTDANKLIYQYSNNYNGLDGLHFVKYLLHIKMTSMFGVMGTYCT